MPTVLWFGPTAHDKRLTLEQLHLSPRGRAAARVIHGLAVLADQSLPSLSFRTRQHLAAIVGHDLAEAHQRLAASLDWKSLLKAKASGGQ